MKTILLVFALGLTVSFSGYASNVTSSVASKTEIGSSKTNYSSSAKMNKSKKPHGIKHHKAMGLKKSPAAK